MSNPVQAFAALPAQIRHAANETSNVVSLTPNKRPRGRPRKPPLVDRRCTDAFETIAVAVVGLAGQKMLWNALKERVRDKADRDNTLSPASRRVLGFLISRMNRNFGYDWHTGERIAAELGISLGSVNRAFGELARAGYIVRKWIAAPGSHASKL